MAQVSNRAAHNMRQRTAQKVNSEIEATKVVSRRKRSRKREQSSSFTLAWVCFPTRAFLHNFIDFPLLPSRTRVIRIMNLFLLVGRAIHSPNKQVASSVPPTHPDVAANNNDNCALFLRGDRYPAEVVLTESAYSSCKTVCYSTLIRTTLYSLCVALLSTLRILVYKKRMRSTPNTFWHTY